MHLTISAIGKLRKSDPRAALIDDYVARIEQTGRGLGFSGMTLTAQEAPKGLSGAVCQEKETALILDSVPERARLIVLDERGSDLQSVDFAHKLENWRDQGVGHTVLAIGGADGHTDQMRTRADLMIRFGKATWPHMMVRLMACEQLYRAMTILAGHPYHRA